VILIFKSIEMKTKKNNSFNSRQFVSVLLSFIFIALILSGIILFLVPSGRIAHADHWQIMGLSKDDWADVHLVFSLFFLIGIVFHVIYNFSCFLHYFKSHITKKLAFRKEWVLAFLGFVLILLLSLSTVWPFGNLQTWRDYFRQEYWEQPGTQAVKGRHQANLETGKRHNEQGTRQKQRESLHSEAEHEAHQGKGFGRMSMNDALEQAGVSYTLAEERLKAAGYTEFNKDESLRKISTRKGQTPRELFDIIAGN